ncbi:nuclease [uncultured Mediterranean phage uvMED]|nr:nuclease [uncultured Mediterranean phage uvMED]
MNKENFSKFDLLPMSYSKLNSFRSYPTQFIINKIFKINTGTNPAMFTGIIVEELLKDLLEGNDSEQNTQYALKDFQRELADYHDQDQVAKYLKLIPKYYENCRALFNRFGNQPLHSYQEELTVEIEGIPFIGYSDFVWDLGEEGMFIFDLKTKGRMAINHSDKLQQLIYKKALEQKYQKPVHCSLFVVTPTKHHFEEIVFTDEHEIEIRNILKGMDKVLQLCNTPKDFAYIYQPNVDDFIWNSPKMVEARRQIWGI